MVKETRLYDRLKVAPIASGSEIRRAYHRLALLYHPDKNPETAEEFREINRAYEVLKDPQKRIIYDRFGETGLYILSSTDSPEVVEFLLNPRRLYWFYFFCSLLVVILGLVPVSLYLKLDGRLEMPWTLLVVPLWVFDGLLMLGASLFALNIVCNRNIPKDYDPSETMHNEKTKNRIARAIVIVTMVTSFILLQLFISLKVDEYISWSWYAVFSPYAVLDTINFFSILLALAIYRNELNDEMRSHANKSTTLAFKAYQSLRCAFWRILFVLLLAWKLEDYFFGLSWWIVFIPVYIGLGSNYTCDFIHNYIYYRQTRLEGNDGREARVIFIGQSIMYGISSASALFFFFLINLNMEYGWRWTLLAFFIPIFVIFGLVFTSCCCCLPCMTGCIQWADLPSTMDSKNDSELDVAEQGNADADFDSENGISRFVYGYGLAPFQLRLTYRI